MKCLDPEEKEKNLGTLYRYDTIRTTAGIDLIMSTYTIVKETKCGVWIKFGLSSKKFVLTKNKGAKKRHAWYTQEEALTSFICRKERQLDILDWQLSDARIALGLARQEYLMKYQKF